MPILLRGAYTHCIVGGAAMTKTTLSNCSKDNSAIFIVKSDKKLFYCEEFLTLK